MTDQTDRCPKCQGTMEPGFILDSAYGGPAPTRWIAGYAERAYLTGLRDRRQIVIAAYRCTACGFVELYASDEPREI